MQAEQSPRIRLLAIALACAAIPALPAESFNSYGKWTNEHALVTTAAAMDKGYEEDAYKRLRKQVRAVDWEQMDVRFDPVFAKWKNLNVLRPFFVTNEAYVWSHHFDRGKTNQGQWRTSASTFNVSAGFVASRTQLAIVEWKAGNKDEAFEALGRALHAIEDLAAHSNAVELTPAVQTQLLDAVFDVLIDPPAALKLTSFCEGLALGGLAPGDPLDYSHDEKSKDTPTKNAEAQKLKDGVTHFQLAMDLGETFAERVLQEFADGLTAAEWQAAKTYASPNPDPGEDLYDWEAQDVFQPGSPLLLQESGTLVAFASNALSETTDVGVMGAPLHFFKGQDEIESSDGATMAVLREIRPMDLDSITSDSIAATVVVSETEVEYLDPDTLELYYMNPTTHDWEVVSGSSVSLSSGSATASFFVNAGGVYAIGGVAAEPPSVPALAPRMGALAALLVAASAFTWLLARGRGGRQRL